MASSPSDNFAKTFLPQHPHRRLHVLLSILAFTVVFSSILFYKINQVSVISNNNVVPELQKSDGLSKEDKQAVMVKLKTESEKAPQLSERQVNEIFRNLNQNQ
ncbi:MAG: hypothetical protein QG640_743 [Patescibacteria group bacterium]|nr:hypothetical protein [Patescibacteria group bacterium]